MKKKPFKKAFASVELYTKNYGMESNITIVAIVRLFASKSMANSENIETKTLYEYTFNPIQKLKESKKQGKNTCIAKVTLSELHKFQDKAGLLFDQYIKEKEKIYEQIEAI